MRKKRKSRKKELELLQGKKIVSITEAALINKVTRQAIYVAIKLNKLKATKEDSKWFIHIDDLMEYRKHKYSRARSLYQGELLFNNQEGFFSVNQVAKMLNVPAQKLYYATRAGYLKASRRGAAWIIHENDLNKYKETHLPIRHNKRQKIQNG